MNMHYIGWPKQLGGGIDESMKATNFEMHADFTEKQTYCFNVSVQLLLWQIK